MSESTIAITFDKSHLTTIGSRLYSESLDLIRELVANAYDADATRVKITTTDAGLIIEDNGEGMDRSGLEQYFTIGSTFKREHNLSPKLKRLRIGEFGIGKFAVLALCDRFELFTTKNDTGFTVVFDRADFENRPTWEVPILEHRAPGSSAGTTVTLTHLKRPIALDQLARKLRHQLPLSQANFSVFLNGVQLRPHYVPGRRFRIREQTAYGPVNGEVIISALLLPSELTGIALRVKGVAVTRDYFDLDRTKFVSARRLTGEITADFLPLTAARDNPLKDSPEYTIFRQVIGKHFKRINKQLSKIRQTRRDLKADRALSDALLKVRQALRRNRSFLLTHDLPLFSPQKHQSDAMKDALGNGVQTASIPAKSSPPKAAAVKLPGEITRKMDRATRARVKTVLKDKNRLVKRLKIGGVNIVCSLTHLDSDEAESFSEGGVIFINRDHPLYSQVSSDDELTAYHLARLITQELTLLANPSSAPQSFEWQSRLLTDAIVEPPR